MAYCPECGVENPNDSLFCLNCGKPLPTIKRSDKSPNKLSSFWNEQTRNGKIIICLVLTCLFTSIVVLSIIYIGTTSSSYYEDENVDFQYISGWTLVKTPENTNKIVEGTYDYAGKIKFFAAKNTSNLSLEHLKENYKKEIISNGGNIISEQQINVDGVPAYEIDSILTENNESLQQKKILLKKGNNSFEIIFTTESDLISYRRSMDTIIKSIHFKDTF